MWVGFVVATFKSDAKLWIEAGPVRHSDLCQCHREKLLSCVREDVGRHYPRHVNGCGYEQARDH